MPHWTSERKIVTRHSSACRRSLTSGGKLAHSAAWPTRCCEGSAAAGSLAAFGPGALLKMAFDEVDIADVVSEGGIIGPLSKAPARPPSLRPTPPTPVTSSLPEDEGAK